MAAVMLVMAGLLLAVVSIQTLDLGRRVSLLYLALEIRNAADACRFVGSLGLAGAFLLVAMGVGQWMTTQ